MKAWISAGLGGRPVKSKVTRRSQVAVSRFGRSDAALFEASEDERVDGLEGPGSVFWTAGRLTG